ncbi:MAG TPA: folate-binding protein [Usitatibacter sp.]|nr:folate-binding protein [Usitatibacter sp.]
MPAASKPILVDLRDNALIAVSGDDATTFLQGQLTNDVAALEAGQAHWTGWCSPKGRLIASLLLVKRPEGYLAMLPAELAPAIAKRLAMFVLRSKVKVAEASAQYERLGLIGAGRPDMGSLEVGRDVHVVIAPIADPRLAALRAESNPGSPGQWTLALIRAGIPTVVAATQEEFVPQMANFDLIGAVSFRKGCYTGQEIVARTQYRGILKKRMAIAHVEGTAPRPGQSVYSTAFGEQSAGMVANAAPAPEGGYDFLVVAQIEGLREGNLRLGSPDGPPIAIRSHPPLDAARQ